MRKGLSPFIYIRGSVRRNSRLKKSNEMEQYAGIYLLLNYSTCFGRPSRPSPGVHKTIVFFFICFYYFFNPCFTAWVCHGVFTMCFLLLAYIAYVLS
jgi:hypothetical protein